MWLVGKTCSEKWGNNNRHPQLQPKSKTLGIYAKSSEICKRSHRHTDIHRNNELHIHTDSCNEAAAKLLNLLYFFFFIFIIFFLVLVFLKIIFQKKREKSLIYRHFVEQSNPLYTGAKITVSTYVCSAIRPQKNLQKTYLKHSIFWPHWIPLAVWVSLYKPTYILICWQL